MKKVGSWFVPNNEEWTDVLDDVRKNTFSCYDTISKCCEFLDSFDQAIDVGTWIGDSTDIMSRLFKNVYGFEANKQVYDCAVENLKNRTNIELQNYALSDKNGSVEFFTGLSTFSGWINTLKENDEMLEYIIKKETFQVESRTLDSYSFKNINFLKLDVDSHEGYVLAGAQQFFKENNPLILIEYKQKVLKRQSKNMIDPIIFLEDIGYEIIDQPSKIDFIMKRKL